MANKERPLTADEQLRVRALRHPFSEARAKILSMLSETPSREAVLCMLREAEDMAVTVMTDEVRKNTSDIAKELVAIIRAAIYAVDAFDQATTEYVIQNLGNRGLVITSRMDYLRASLAEAGYYPPLKESQEKLRE